MTYQHKELAAGRWEQLSFLEQMANIGSEVIRTIKWKNKGNNSLKDSAFYRALELFDLTMSDGRNTKRLKELARLRETFADYVCGHNEFNASDINWERYFLAFNIAARAGA